MKKENLKVTESSLERLIHISLFTYLFFLIFPHTTTLREIAFWTAFICWIGLRIRKQEPLVPLNPITIPLYLFMIIAFISSVIGSEPIENLKQFKGDIAVPFILFLITATEFDSIKKIKRLLLVFLISLAIYTLLTIIESINYGLPYFWGETAGAQYPWKMENSLIFTITLGYILLIKNKRFRYSLIAFAILEFILLTAYRSFATFLGAISVLVLWLLFVKPKKYRLWMLVFIFLFIFIFGLLFYVQKDNPAVAEYKAKFEKIVNIQEELRSDSGLTDRIALWKAAADILKDRPLLGYGWGIEKFKKLTHQEKFIEQWKIKRPYVYDLFIKRNEFLLPHNIFIDIAIQSGLIGVVSFLVFIGVYVFYIIRIGMRSNSVVDYNFLIILIGSVILIFMITNFLNSELGKASGKIFFVVLGAGMGWIKDKESKYSTHSFVR